MLSILIPANNEAAYLGTCLEALLASDVQTGDGVEVIVVANGCTDDTVQIARSYAGRAAERGWCLKVLELADGGKLNAINAGEKAASGDTLVYVDADTRVSPGLLAELRTALDRPEPAYASGKVVIAPSRNLVSRLYGRFWARVPYMTECVPGCGVFAVNMAGRRRWREFPQIISDDMFARLNFAPQERIGVPASYVWPIAEGFSRLVLVRRRQDVGVDEIARRFPDLMRNEDKPPMGAVRLFRLCLSDPVGFCVYSAVALAVRVRRDRHGHAWVRGR